MSTTPVYGLTLGEEGQANGWPTANELFRLIELLGGTLPFKGFNTNTPPGSPSEGDTYWSGGSPTGDWSGHDNEIVTYFNGEWKFYDPKSTGLDIDGIYGFNSTANAAIVFSSTTDSWGSIARMQEINTFEAANTFEGDVTLETGVVQEEFSLSAVAQAFTPNFNYAARQIANCSSYSTGSITLNNAANLTAGKTIRLLIIGPSASLPLVTPVTWNTLDESLTTLVAGEDLEVLLHCRGSAQTDIWYSISRADVKSHTVASHSDTSATGTELDTLTDGSNADSLHVHGGGAVAFATTSKTGSYSMTAADLFVDVDASGGAATIIPLAPSGTTGKLMGVKKIDSSANTVTVNPAGTNTIDGSLTYVLSSQWNAVLFMSNGSQYLIWGSH